MNFIRLLNIMSMLKVFLEIHWGIRHFPLLGHKLFPPVLKARFQWDSFHSTQIKIQLFFVSQNFTVDFSYHHFQTSTAQSLFGFQGHDYYEVWFIQFVFTIVFCTYGAHPVDVSLGSEDYGTIDKRFVGNILKTGKAKGNQIPTPSELGPRNQIHYYYLF